VASAPYDPGTVSGRVDLDGKLVEADSALLRLQQEAGSMLGAPLALPQLAALARSALKLGVPLSRPVIAASADQDLDLWVRAEPDRDGVNLTIDGWKARPPAPPRLTLVGQELAEEADSQGASTLDLQTDAELKIISIDEDLASRLGTEPAAAVGQPITRFFLLVNEADGAMPMLVALGGRQDFSGQPARIRGGETEAVVHLSGIATQPDGGRFTGYTITVDMGEAAQGPAGVFDPALDEALRSPLDRIIAAADRIVDRSEGPLRSDYAAYAGDIAAAGRHLLSVIHAMTQQDAGEHSLIDLTRCAQEAVQLVQARGVEDGIRIQMSGADQPMMAFGEDRGTVQILVNILGNAVRHSPPQGNIAVILERRDGQVGVTVADEGPGIHPADQDRIFERYERVGDSPGGIGLGLSISRRLARSMGGDILLVSAPGNGARFTLLLPAAAA
jgi:signal transduction histidine kinase